jgi:putative inorganic carbon (HCO3(-)) transporter
MISIVKNNFIGFASLLFILVNVFFIYNEIYYFCFFPIAVILIYLTVFKLDYILLALVFCTPLSFNLEAVSAGGFGLYIPTEPILLMLLMLYFFKIFYKKNNNLNTYWRHPISFIILFQLTWIFLTCFSSEYPIVSFKFLLSRLWFVIPIFFLGIHFFKKGIDYIYAFLWAFLIPLTIILIYTLANHAANGFSEEAGHWVMWPFFKDHTSYGAIIALFIPIVIGMMTDSKRSIYSKNILYVVFLIFCIALYYSYTRAAWVSVIAALFVYLLFVFKIKFKWLLSVGLIIGSLIIVNFNELSFLLAKNNAEHTTEDFNERIESISNVSSDASNLERFNRWNSAIRMFQERPIQGWGPGTYAFCYAPFQDSKDLTIISTNFGDGGNAHSEYLGPLAEQGLFGMLLMILLVIVFFYKASMLYIHASNPALKRLVMMILLGMVTYFTHGILNNYLDTDKASVPVWGIMAMVVAIDLFYDKEEKHKTIDTNSSLNY